MIPLSRDMTFNDVSQSGAVESSCAEIVMDEDTFRGFYDRNARAVWAYLTRITGDRHVADDLLQEAFYRFLRAGAVHETEAHRRNSIFRIATNLARDARRRSLTRPAAAVSGDDIERITSPENGPAAELSSEVSVALAELKPREREMLWLAYAEGASHREIAGVLGVREGSMKALLFRARRKLAAILEGRR